MTRLARLSLCSLTLALLALGGASAAHATTCTVGSGSALESGLVDPGGAGSCGTESVTEPVTETEGGDSLTLLSLDAPIAQTYGSYGSCQVARGTGYHHCNPPVVPLPPSSLLLVSGALALLILGRRRRLATA